MTSKMCIGFILMLVAAVAIGGCRDKKNRSSSENTPVGGETPKDTMLKMAKAMDDMDIDSLLANIDAPDEYKEIMLAYFENMKIRAEFEKKLKETYSEEEIKESGVRDSFRPNRPSNEEIEKLEFKIDGDTATADMKDGEPIKFVKKDGRWFVSVMDEVKKSTPEDLEKGMKIADTWYAPYRKLLPKIGAEGYTAKRIKQELDELRIEALEKGFQRNEGY